MQQTDDIVSGWLNGRDDVDGQANPAGPLYIEGSAVTEAALTDRQTNVTIGHGVTGTSCSFTGGCCCC